MLNQRVRDYLDREGVHYETLTHPQSFTSSETAHVAHVPGREFAKTVVVKLDGKLALAVLPATKRLDFLLLRDAAQAETVEQVHEWGFGERFSDCEIGAMPPLGRLFGVNVFLDESLTKAGEVVFNGGTHTDLVKMNAKDFERVAHPKLVSITESD